MGKIIEFLATVGVEGTKIFEYEKSWHAHWKIIIYFFIKYFESKLGTNKEYLIMNIWTYTIEHRFQKKYFCEPFSENPSVKFKQILITWTKFQRLRFYCFLIHNIQLKTCKKGALCFCSMYVMITQSIGVLGVSRNACTFSCKVLQILCFWPCPLHCYCVKNKRVTLSG